MSDLIVLELPSWAKYEDDFGSLDDNMPSCSRCTPVFNRPGMYVRRKEKKVWFEMPDGRAYTYEYTQVKYGMDYAYWDNHPNAEAVYASLKVLKAAGLLRKNQKEWLYVLQQVCDHSHDAYSAAARLRLYKFKKARGL